MNRQGVAVTSAFVFSMLFGTWFYQAAFEKDIMHLIAKRSVSHFLLNVWFYDIGQFCLFMTFVIFPLSCLIYAWVRVPKMKNV